MDFAKLRNSAATGRCGLNWRIILVLHRRTGLLRTSRSHEGIERGTNKVVRSGRKRALDFVQAKRNLALLRKTHPDVYLNRREAMQVSPLPIRHFLPFAATMSARLLRYNRSLLLMSTPLRWRYAAFQTAVRILGTNFIRALSRLLGMFAKRR